MATAEDMVPLANRGALGAFAFQRHPSMQRSHPMKHTSYVDRVNHVTKFSSLALTSATLRLPA